MAVLHEGESPVLIRGARPPPDGGDNDLPLIDVEIEKDSVTADTPPPAKRLQALDVTAEGIALESGQRALNAIPVSAGKSCEVSSCGLGYE
jgi:hypothetical protein